MNITLCALRNVWRTRQRSGVIILAMGFAGFIMIFYAALMEGLLRTTERNAIAMETGQIQIHDPGYRDDPDLYKMVAGSAPVLDLLAAAGFQAAPRLYGFALAAAGNASAGVQLRGVAIAPESRVTEIHQHLLAGNWLAEDDPEGVVIGRKLARVLGLAVGGEVVVVGQAADGSTANQIFRVRGVLKTANENIDRAGFFLLEKTFRSLLVMPAGYHEIALRYSGADGQLLDSHTRALATRLTGLEVRNWRQLQPVLARVLDLSRYSLLLMLFITYTAVGILTLNSMLMAVFERIQEFGIIKALGVPPWQVFVLIVVETVIQILAASVLAVVTALPLSLYCQTHPVDLSALASTSASIAGIALDPFWYSQVTPETVLAPLLVMATMALLSVIYPALKAARIKPLAAIHFR
ncbi:MAG: ABC transporter permease [Desulfobulbaceae bacterium]|nr:ABC transporter permease [Desulfobulbaceae bacterium]